MTTNEAVIRLQSAKFPLIKAQRELKALDLRSVPHTAARDEIRGVRDDIGELLKSLDWAVKQLNGK